MLFKPSSVSIEYFVENKDLESYYRIVEKIGCVIVASRKKQENQYQISIYDIALKSGDKLYKDGIMYGEITGESESLYFVMKTTSKDNIPIPYHKDTLRNNILLGKLTLENYRYS